MLNTLEMLRKCWWYKISSISGIRNKLISIYLWLKRKKPQQSGYRGNKPQHIKGHIWQTLKSSPLRWGTRQGCPLLQLLFYMVLEVLAIAIRQKKKKIRHPNQKGVKLLPCADDIILQIENPNCCSVAKSYLTLCKPMDYIWTNEWIQESCRIQNQ